MAGLVAQLSDFTDDETGATAIEYGLIAALLAVACIAAITLFGNSLVGLFGAIQDRAGGAMDNASI